MEQRTIVVTGVTRGLGRALARKLASLGHTIIGCGRSEAGLRDLQHETTGSLSLKQIDIANPHQVNTWAAAAEAKFGAPDLLINNAGIMNPDAPFVDVPPSQFDQLIDVNVKGTANVIRAFLPAMLERQRGVVVNITSGAGVRGYPQLSAYGTSKFAIEGLSKSLAQEIPPTMAIIPLQPGVIDTDMLRGHYGNRAGDYDSPERWAEYAVPFILALGPEHNGQSIRIPRQSS